MSFLLRLLCQTSGPASRTKCPAARPLYATGGGVVKDLWIGEFSPEVQPSPVFPAQAGIQSKKPTGSGLIRRNRGPTLKQPGGFSLAAVCGWMDSCLRRNDGFEAKKINPLQAPVNSTHPDSPPHWQRGRKHDHNQCEAKRYNQLSQERFKDFH